jgi:hypothetical protein
MLIIPSSGPEQFGKTFVEQPSGLITLHEPFLGEQMQPGVIPDILRRWPLLKEGYDFLESDGERIDLSLFLTRHGSVGDLAASGIDLRSEALRIQAARGILFLEGQHTAESSGALNRLYNEVAHGETTPEEARLSFTNTTSPGFQLDLMEQIHDTQVRVECPDVQTRQNPATMNIVGPVHETLYQWRLAYESKKAAPITSEMSRDSLALETGYHLFREAVIVGLMGVSMSRFRYSGMPNAPAVGGLVIGAAHKGMAATIDALTGRLTRKVGEVHIIDPHTHAILDSLGKASISAVTMETLHLLRKLDLTE